MRVPRRWTWLSLAGVLLACLAARATGADLSAANAPQLIKRGEYLARVGNCVGCHTADPARPFAGGRPIATRFGTIHTPNITSDPETGIGRWTDAEFLRAMHEGIGKSGKRLYPAFPYVEYTKVTDQDVLAIRAYLGAVAPVRYTPPRNDLAFPFNLRWLMVFWNLLNFTEGRFVPDPEGERRAESRRVSGRRARALRRMPYAAQPDARLEHERALRRRHERRAGTPTTSRLTRTPASATGATTI